MSSDSITINVTGGKQAQVAGKIENRDSHIGDVINGEVPTIESVFKTIAKVVPPEEQEKIEEEVFGPLKEELDALTAMPIATVEKPVASSIEKIQAFVQPLAPYAGKIGAAIGAGLEAGLSLVAPPAGWFISATLAAIKALRGTN